MPDFETEPLNVDPEPVQAALSTRKPAGRVALGTVVLSLAAVVAIGGVAFAVGRVTAPQQAAAANAFRNGFGAGAENGTGTGTGRGFFGGTGGTGGAGGFGGGAFRGLGVQGTVTAVDPTSISIQLANGTTIDIPTDSSTTYHTQQAGTASDVQVGKQVEVQVSRSATTGGAAPSPGAGGAPNFGTASDVTVLGN